MKSIIKILLLLSGLSFAACHKREYPPDLVEATAHDIFFNGTAGSEEISLKAGADGYYCYSSFKQGPDSVYIFEGTLRKRDCNTCEQFQLELTDYCRRTPGITVPPDSAFRTGSRKLIPAVATVHTLRFTSHSNKLITLSKWNSQSGLISEDSVTDFEFTQPGLQTVSLTVKTSGNSENTIINRVYVDKQNGIFACSVNSTAAPASGAQFAATIIGGRAPYKYSWNFGDGSSSLLDAPQHSYKYGGSYPVKLQVEDADHRICEANYICVAGKDISSCSLYMSVAHAGNTNKSLDGVKLQWTDRSGITFRSESIAQPGASYFEILNSQNYAANEKGEAGRLLTIRFNVLLSDGTREIWFKSENAAIAVSYK